MSQVHLKELAHKVLKDEHIPFNHITKILARAVITYFDPEHFSVPTKERERLIMRRKRAWEP